MIAAEDAVAGEAPWAPESLALLAMLPIRKIVRTAESGVDDAKSLLTSIGEGASKCQSFVTVIWFRVNVPVKLSVISPEPSCKKRCTSLVTANNVHRAQCFHAWQPPDNRSLFSHS